MRSLRTVSIWVFILFLMGIFSHHSSAEPIQDSSLILENQLTIAAKVPRGPFSQKELKKYLSGQKPSWADEEPVTIVLFPKKSPELKWLCTNFLKIPPSTYRRFLIQKAFRSGINIVEVQSQDEALSVLQEIPGAIAPIYDTHLSKEIHAVTLK